MDLKKTTGEKTAVSKKVAGGKPVSAKRTGVKQGSEKHPVSTTVSKTAAAPAEKKRQAKLPAASGTGNAVDKLVNALPADQRDPVQLLRKIIMAASPLVDEQIKWNSPAFFYTGEMKPFDPKEYKRDIVVMNLHRGRIMLVFPTGARLSNDSGLLTGDYKDGRRIINFTGTADITKHRKALTSVIVQWISLVD